MSAIPLLLVPLVVQRILGHSTATMTLDLYGHLWDSSLWAAAERLGHISVTFETELRESEQDDPSRGRP